MISVELARGLRTAGLRWHPERGDRFTIDSSHFDGDVFVISDMTVEAHEHPTGTVLGFNGTTEWALDSVAAADSLWLPREDQLRLLLGPTFRSLSVDDAGRATVTTSRGTSSGDEPEEAYARALLAYISASLTLD